MAACAAMARRGIAPVAPGSAPHLSISVRDDGNVRAVAVRQTPRGHLWDGSSGMSAKAYMLRSLVPREGRGCTATAVLEALEALRGQQPAKLRQGSPR